MKKANFILHAVALSCILLSGTQESGAQSIILTSDQQLNDLTDPDKKIDMSLGFNKYVRSLREVCEEGKNRGSKEVIVAFDEFFRQYRHDSGSERKLTPDMDEYVDKIKIVSDFVKQYDMGLCLSLLSPLELGQAYKKLTGNSGRWLAYKVGFRDPASGKFTLQIWHQLAWTNNKGKSPVALKGVKAYAFKEKALAYGPFRAVDPDDIIEIKNISYQASDTLRLINGQSVTHGVAGEGGFDMRNITVTGHGGELQGYDRVMVVLEYETQEMDYFHEDALPFLKNMMKKYYDKGVNLTALYSDEMHIQQDWDYFHHHENGQFAQRYLTPAMMERYERKFGQPFSDKHMLYFAYGAPYFEPIALAVVNVQYVMGDKPQDIYRTFLLRDRYYKMLNNDVVDLFKEAKDYSEDLFGRELLTSAHASWAQSPTIDLWNLEKLFTFATHYEYTSNFLWSNTVHQAAAACYDYFKWSEYLRPTGNDFAEGGWSDRNYYGAALASSIGAINKYPSAYAAAWGMPGPVHEWKMEISHAYGAQAPAHITNVIGGVHRDVDVLILYPLSLVAAEERFGGWMTQYGYANYLSAEMLVKLGKVLPDGKVQVGDKTYGTVVAIYEPLPQRGLLGMMKQMTDRGGKVFWFGTPPLLDSEGADCSAEWRNLFGAAYEFGTYLGEIAAGRKVSFEGSLSSVPEQIVLTDFLVDRIYPVGSAGGEVTAKCGGKVIGIKKGNANYFGFRPRDDQSHSLGYETRTLFELLDKAGSYPASGRFAGVNDNPSHVSRTSDCFASSFPNGATMIVKHYRTHAESWPGGFSRNKDEDAEILKANPLPSDRISLDGAKINGHEVTYDGNMSMAFRTAADGGLSAFYGRGCTGVTVDGKKYAFSDKPLNRISFAPQPDNARAYTVQVVGEGTVNIPLPTEFRNPSVKQGENVVPSEMNDNGISIRIDPSLSGKWLTITE